MEKIITIVVSLLICNFTYAEDYSENPAYCKFYKSLEKGEIKSFNIVITQSPLLPIPVDNTIYVDSFPGYKVGDTVKCYKDSSGEIVTLLQPKLILGGTYRVGTYCPTGT